MRIRPTSALLMLVLALTSAGFAQRSRTATRLDDPRLSESPDEAPQVASEGANRVVAWSDYRSGIENIFIATSTDFGRTWSSEQRITDQLSSGARTENPRIALQNGVLHLSYVAKYSPSDWRMEYMQSTDLGQTWSTAITLGDGNIFHQMEVEGDRILIVWREGGPAELVACWSTDGGTSFGPVKFIDPLNLGQYHVNTFDIDIVPFSGAGVVLIEDDRAGEQNLYLYNGTPGSQFWGLLGRVDDDTQGVSDPFSINLEVHGLELHMAWAENGRPGSNGKSAIYYRGYIGGAFQAERVIGQYSFGVHSASFPDLAVNDDLLAIAWRDDRNPSSANDRPYVAVSHDNGASFLPDATLPERPFSAFVFKVELAADEHNLVLACDERQPGSGSAVLPVAMVSGDAGASWSDPIDFENPADGIQSLRFEEESLVFCGDDLTWAFNVERNATDQIHVNGLRFPVVEYESIVGGTPKGILRLKYADPNQVGQTARWAASSAMGEVVHPENPALFLDLAPSGLYNQSLAKANALRAVIQTDGTAETNAIPIKPGLVGKQVFIQGWVNDNGVGQPASDVILATL